MSDLEKNAKYRICEIISGDSVDINMLPLIMRKYDLYKQVLEYNVQELLNLYINNNSKEALPVPINMRKYLLYKQIMTD